VASISCVPERVLACTFVPFVFSKNENLIMFFDWLDCLLSLCFVPLLILNSQCIIGLEINVFKCDLVNIIYAFIMF
jgi:hypothetical protein